MLVTAVAVFICIPARSSDVVLAKDYPFSQVFMQMIITAVGDYAVEHRCFPDSIKALLDAGFIPYSSPPVVGYSSTGTTAKLTSKGQPVIIGGQPTDELSHEWLKLPKEGLYHLGQVPMPEQGEGGKQVIVLREQKIWHWRGAEWVDSGYSWGDVSLGLKASRLRLVLYWATYDYMTSTGRLPKDFAELEEYIGLQRNPAGWSDLTLVSSVDELNLYPGTVFVGYDYQGNWRVSANLGPKIQETIWSWGDGGVQQSSTDTLY